MLEKIAAIIREGEFFSGRRSVYAVPNNQKSQQMVTEHPARECVEWEEGNNKYAAEFAVLQSPKLVVFKGCYWKNDEPTTLSTIKSSYRRIMANRLANQVMAA